MPDILPPCGIYRTTQPVGDVPAGRLVYFHNHGTPGPGVYLPESWSQNRAKFAETGHTLPMPFDFHARLLEPLPPEGFYRVQKSFFCCEKKCREFETDLLVQLGYNGAADAILFVPEMSAGGMTIPSSGSAVSRGDLGKLTLLKVAERHEHAPAKGPVTANRMMH